MVFTQQKWVFCAPKHPLLQRQMVSTVSV